MNTISDKVNFRAKIRDKKVYFIIIKESVQQVH